MSRSASKAILFVALMLLASTTPMIGSASASNPVLLTLDNPHIAIQGGDSTNITLTIENAGDYTTSYNISVETVHLSNAWTVTLASETTGDVIPTQSTTIDIAVVLGIDAMPADSGSFVINVSEYGDQFYNTITSTLTVEPSYASSLAFNSANGPLQQMLAGTTTSFSVDVNNDGNAPDTILLAVDAEPDLSGFWANHSNNTGSQNNTTSSAVDVPENVLIYGDSFIHTNNLETILADMFNSVGEHNSTIANTAGSLSFENHWNNINTSGDVWNTSLRDSGHDWDYVILQDQSQIPGYNRTDEEWIASNTSGIHIANAVESEGSEIMLMMTWGYRSGDVTNAFIYPDYPTMQERLRQGYVDYHNNMTTPTRNVWIAPVGLGFANVYQSVLDSGAIPELPGTSFYDLYDNNGINPSLSGSYLAACIIYASMTGNFTVETNDSIALPAADKLALQQAADDTVFNQTSNISYPWEQSSGPSLQNQARNIPPGWNLVFADQELSNIPAATTQQTSIQVTVPSDATPGFYGFNLFSASANGNSSNSYTFVIEVVPENDLSFSFLDQSADFIPGQITTTSVQVTNTGNAELDLNWALSVDSGPCVVQLIDAQIEGLSPGDVAGIGLTVEVDATATQADGCVISLTGEGMYGDYTYEPDPFSFTLDVDELVEFELYIPNTGPVALTPQNAEQYEIRIYNNGSETVEFYLDVADGSPLQSSIVGATSVNVSSGAVGAWTLTTDVADGVVGLYDQIFIVNYASLSSTITASFDVQPVAEFSLNGPLDGRISTKPGESVDVALDLSNMGTMDLELSASVSGLPTGAEVTFSDVEVDLDAGTTLSVAMSVSMISTAQSGAYGITVSYSSADFSQSLNLELQVADSVGLTVNSINNNIAAGPISEVTYTFEVTNLGSASDTFFVSLDFAEGNNNATIWFDTALSTTSVNLEPSSTQAVTITIRERAAGAPSTGCDVNIVVTSSNDDTVSSGIAFKILPIQASAQITVLSADDSAKPGETITGDVVVTNTGTGEDQFTLTTIGEDCDLSEIFSLSAGTSSQAYSWNCVVDSDEDAGLSSFTFRVTSNARSDYVLEVVEFYTVEPNWDSDGIAEISFADETLSMASSGGSSTTITVRNLANAPILGSITILGIDESLFDFTVTPSGSETESKEFTLNNGQSTEFKLLITSRISESESALLDISASIEIDGVTYQQKSANQLAITVDGPELPPNGVELPLGIKLDAQQTISIMFGGWALTVFLLILMNTLRKRRTLSSVAATLEEAGGDNSADKPDKKPKKKEEKTVQAHKLKSNECRMTPDNKVLCPFCEAKLGVPRGSEPPFKFTCPQCDKKIRVVENQKF
tara:strand:- start:543 stop:4586 length:4044 start_codon:yes stop_codon:yes gene_type:complete